MSYSLPIYKSSSTSSYSSKSKSLTLRTLLQTINRFIHTILHEKSTRKVFFFLLLNLSFTVVEAAYGVWTNSLGLTSDAVHMLFDSSAIIFSLCASVVAKWEGNDRFTFGYTRVETLTGFVNGTALLFAGCSIIWESLERIFDPPNINKDNLLTVAVLGFLVNLVGIFAFDHGHMPGHSHDCGGSGHSHDNPLMQGMFLHVLADTLGSVGVITSSILIEKYGWTWADPVCSMFIAVMILMSVWPLLKASAFTLLQRVPCGFEGKYQEALRRILSIPEVQTYHTPHFWEMSSGYYIATICVQTRYSADDQRVRMAVTEIIRDVVGCREVVVQIEKEYNGGVHMPVVDHGCTHSHSHDHGDGHGHGH